MAGLQNHRRRLLITRLLSAQGPEDTNYEPEAGGNVTGLSVRSADSGPDSAGWTGRECESTAEWITQFVPSG